MIIGIGCDIVDIRRIEKILKKYDETFINRIFSQDEQELAPQGKNIAAYYAKRFAAKEALVKALGLGFRHGIRWDEISTTRSKYGKPIINLTGMALKQLESLLLSHFNILKDNVKLHITISDELPYAQAFVVIEGII